MLSNINTELTSLRESQLLVTKRLNNNLLKQNHILERKCNPNKHYSRQECLEILGIPGNISNNNFEETVLKFVSKTCIAVDSRDVETWHYLN